MTPPTLNDYQSLFERMLRAGWIVRAATGRGEFAVIWTPLGRQRCADLLTLHQELHMPFPAEREAWLALAIELDNKPTVGSGD